MYINTHIIYIYTHTQDVCYATDESKIDEKDNSTKKRLLSIKKLGSLGSNICIPLIAPPHVHLSSKTKIEKWLLG